MEAVCFCGNLIVPHPTELDENEEPRPFRGFMNMWCDRRDCSEYMKPVMPMPSAIDPTQN